MRKKKRQETEEEISNEEMTYRTAAGIMDSVDCVLIYKRKAAALRSAADKFDSIGDYKNSRAMAEECRAMAAEEEENGPERSYREIEKKFGQASSDDDYRLLISLYNDMDGYRESRERAAECEKLLELSQKKAARRNRIVALVIVVLFVASMRFTPVYPLAKGIYYNHKGNYDMAVLNFKAADGMPFQENLLRKAYYYKGLDAEKKGMLQHQIKYFSKAGTYRDAAERAAKLEKVMLSQQEPGQKIKFGGYEWMVLEKTDDTAEVIRKQPVADKVFDFYGNDWETSAIRVWLNTGYKTDNFSDQERAMMVKRDYGTENITTKDWVSMLTTDEYEKYKDILPDTKKGWWLINSDRTGLKKGTGDLKKIDETRPDPTPTPDEEEADPEKVTPDPKPTPTPDLSFKAPGVPVVTAEKTIETIAANNKEKHAARPVLTLKFK